MKTFPGEQALVLIIICCLCFLQGCKTIYQPDSKKTAATSQAITPVDSLVKKQRSGMDFFAQGSNPVSWTLELDLENGFVFKAAGSSKLIASPVKPGKMPGTESIIYEAVTDSGMMKIIIFQALCETTSASNKSGKKVEISLNDKRYLGCGSALYDPLINDIWILEYINNKSISRSDYKKQLPMLEFNIEKNRMTGFDGCKNISSTIDIMGNHISFSNFAGAGKSCPGQEAGEILSKLVSGHTVDYYTKDGDLVLILLDDSRLVFRKYE